MTASPISDLNPLFLSAGCVLELASTGECSTGVYVKNSLAPPTLFRLSLDL